MEAEWEGPKDTRFDITKFEAEKLLDDENCGKKLSECKHRYGANGYQSRVVNGKCVRALHCHYADYDDVKFEIKGNIISTKINFGYDRNRDTKFKRGF